MFLFTSLATVKSSIDFLLALFNGIPMAVFFLFGEPHTVSFSGSDAYPWHYIKQTELFNRLKYCPLQQFRLSEIKST